jgi:hypothetical protein
VTDIGTNRILVRFRWILDELGRSQAAITNEQKRLTSLIADAERLVNPLPQLIEPKGSAEPEGDHLILLGYTHASVIGVHRPEVAYPDRKVQPSPTSITTIYTKPCTCPDRHTEVWVEPIVDQDLQQRLFY